MGLEPGDLAGAVPGHDGKQLAVTVGDSQGGAAGPGGDDAPGVGQAGLDVLAGGPDTAAAGHLALDHELADGSGFGPASRTPCSLCRWLAGMGQGRIISSRKIFRAATARGIKRDPYRRPGYPSRRT